MAHATTLKAITGLVHAAMLFRWVVLEGRARPEVGRARGMRIFGVYAGRVFLYPTLRKKTRTREWARRERTKWAKSRHKWVKRHTWARAVTRATSVTRPTAVTKASGIARARRITRVTGTTRARAVASAL